MLGDIFFPLIMFNHAPTALKENVDLEVTESAERRFSLANEFADKDLETEETDFT